MGSHIEQAFTDILSAEVAKQPLLLVLEDLHWGDVPSVKLIGAALDHLPSLPWMVLGICRPEISEALLEPFEQYGMQRLHVDRLRPQAGTELVRHVLGDGVSDQTVRKLVDQTEGHAFFLEEVIRAHVDGETNKSIPPTVLAMSQSRLEALSLDERTVLRAASILGQTFRPEGVTLLVQRPLRDVEAQLESLSGQELLTVRPVGAFTEYSFRHTLLRDAAYAMLTDEDLRLGHRLAGEWLEDTGIEEPVVLAEHYAKAGLPERAIPHLRRAAERALEGQDVEGTLHLCGRCVTAGAAEATLGKIRLLEAEAELWRGNFRLVARRSREAMGLLPEESGDWGVACALRIVGTSRIDRNDEARMVGDVLLESALSAPRNERWMQGLARAASEFAYAHQWEHARKLSSVLSQWEEAGFEPSMVTKATWLNMQASKELLDGDVGAYLENRRKAQELWREGGDSRRVVAAFGQIAYALNLLGRHEEALECFQSCLAEAREPQTVLGAKHNMGLALARLGRPEEGLELEREAIAGFRAMGAKRMESGSRCYASRIALLGGDALEAERHARDAVASSRELGPDSVVAAAGMLAAALAAQGRYLDALDAACRVDDGLESGTQVDEVELYLRLTCAEVFHGVGNRPKAIAAIRSAHEDLGKRAQRIADPELRASFLAIEEHARIRQLYQDWCRSQ